MHNGMTAQAKIRSAMIRVELASVSVELPALLGHALATGESIVICDKNEPIAEVRPVTPPERRTPRPIGLAKGTFRIPGSFFEPLPSEVLDAFSGGSS